MATDTTAKLKKLKGKRIVVTIKQIVPLMITEYKDDFSQFTFALRGQILNLKKLVYTYEIYFIVLQICRKTSMQMRRD